MRWLRIQKHRMRRRERTIMGVSTIVRIACKSPFGEAQCDSWQRLSFIDGAHTVVSAFAHRSDVCNAAASECPPRPPVLPEQLYVNKDTSRACRAFAPMLAGMVAPG